MSAGVWLEVHHIATLHGVDRETVRNWRRRGRVTSRKRYGVWEINAESVERYLNTRGRNGLRPGKGTAA